MKASYTTLLFLFFFFLSITAQSTLEKAGGTSNDESLDVEIDAAGNMYSCGYISNFVNFGSLTVDPPQGQSDIYVAKQNSAGTFLWVKRFAGTLDERAYDLYVDPSGMIYITGYFYGHTHFDNITLNSTNNSRDLFVAKLDNSGNVLWAKSEGGSHGETGYGICADSQGNVIVTGQFQEQITVGTDTYIAPISTITNLPTFDLILIKYDANGNILWSKDGSSKGENRGLAVVCDNSDNILITGQFSDTLTIDGTTLNNNGYNIGMIAKFSPNGNMNWLRRIVANQTMAYDIKCNVAKDAYITGDFKGGGFNFIDNSGTHSSSSNYLYNIFVLKINSAGSFNWVQSDGSKNEVSSKAIALDAVEDPYISGIFRCKFGEYSDALSADSGYFYSLGYNDVFVTKYSNQGQRQWFRQYGSAKDDYCSGIAISTPNIPVVSGSFERTFFAQMTSSFTTSDLTTHFTYANCSGSGTNCNLNATFGIVNKDIFVGRINSFSLPPISYFNPNCNQFYLPEIPSDTLIFCNNGSACVTPHTYDNSYSPIFDYSWSNGDSTQCTQGLYSNTNLTVDIQREDHCYSNADTVFVIINPIPSMPLLTDDFPVNVYTPAYNDIKSCYPDTVSLWFTNLDTTCTYSITQNGSPISITDTTISWQNHDWGVTVTSSLGCQNYEDFKHIFITVDTPIVIKPYIRMVDNIDMNDSLRICPGIRVYFVGKDSLTNSGAYFDPFCTNYGYVDQQWTSSIWMDNPSLDSINCLHSFFTPTTTGWYHVKMELILGGMNQCGIDTIHMIVKDSFYIEIVPAPPIHLFTNSIVCPGNFGYVWADTTFNGMVWSTEDLLPFTVLSGGDSILIDTQDVVHYSGYFIYQGNVECYEDKSILIEFWDNPTITTNIPDNIICPGDSVLLTCQSGLHYEWIGPQGQVIDTTQSVWVHDLGFYHCNQTNFAGCMMPSNFIELKGYATPILTVSEDAFLCAGESATITVTTVGTPNFNWINPPGNLTSSITVNQPGVYICEITQCGFTVTDSAEIYDATFSISLNISGDSTICFGDSLTVSTNPSLMGYQWSMNDNGSYYTFAAQEGIYTVTGTNEYGCTAQSDSLTLHINNGSKTPTFTSQTICQGDEAIFIYTDSNNVYWYADSLGTQLISIADTFTISQLQNDTTIYLIQYAGNCQSTIIASTVHVSSISNGISITGDTTICNNASIELASTFAGVSAWTGPNSFSSTQDSIIINNVSATDEGWYFLDITDGTCHKMDSIWVNVSQPLNNQLNTSGIITICSGSQVNLSALDSNYQIYWQPNGETTQSITVSNEGQYFVSLTDSNGCNALSDTITIAFFQNAAPLLSDTSVCFGNSFSFNDTSSYNLNWYDLDTNFIATENLILSNLTSDTSFYYQYLDTFTGCNANLNLYTIHVLPSTAPVILGDSIICGNIEHNYIVSYQSDGTSSWSVNGNPLSTQGSIDIFLDMDTSFYLVLTTTGSSCSNGMDSLFIQNLLPSRPILADSMTTICNNFAMNWVTNNNGYDVLWTTDLGNTSYDDTLYMHFNQNINAYGEVVFIDSNGCQSTATYFNAIPAIAALYSLVQANTTCVGDTIIALGYADGAMDSYWITPNGNQNNDTIILNGIDASNSGNYIFVVEDSSSCISKDTFNLQVGTPPQFSLGMDTILCNGSSLIVSSPQDSSFVWSNGSTDATQEISTSIDLVLTIWSGTYCPSTDTISIQFIDCEAEAANVITSNGDGINDVLYIKDSEYMPDDYIIITNRWGNLIYEAHDYKNDFNPAVTNVADGVYFYVYYRTWNPKDPHPLTGFFHIIH